MGCGLILNRICEVCRRRYGEHRVGDDACPDFPASLPPLSKGRDKFLTTTFTKRPRAAADAKGDGK